MRQWAVSMPTQESDLAALPPAQFQQQLARVQEPPSDTTLGAGLLGPSSNRKELGGVLLLAVLALLFIEVFVANRMLA